MFFSCLIVGTWSALIAIPPMVARLMSGEWIYDTSLEGTALTENTGAVYSASANPRSKAA